MRKKLVSLLSAIFLIMACAFTLTACAGGDGGDPFTPPTQADFESAISNALNIEGTDFSYTLIVGEETTTITVDGDNVRQQKTVGEQESTLITVFKDSNGYYKLAPYTSWEQYAHPVYAWEDYYQKTSVSAQTVNGYKNAYVEYLPTFDYSSFSFNKTSNGFVANSITLEEKEYQNVLICLDDLKNLSKVEYTLVEDSNSTAVSVEFTLADMTISKPDNVITYVNPIPEEYEDSFMFNYANYSCVYEEYLVGYLKPNRIKFEKTGTKISVSQMTYNDDDYTTTTYYDKDETNFYKFKFDAVSNVWYKIRITEKAYVEAENTVLNTILFHNGGYEFDHLSQGPYAYSVSAGSGESVLTIFHVDYKVDRIVVGMFVKDASKYPEAQFRFDYGTANVVIPESQTAPYNVQLSEDWKTFFYQENYMDFTATIRSGDGKTSIYQSDYNNGTQTVYIGINAYNDSSKQYVQKTATGAYTYEYLMSNNNWYKETSSVQYGSASSIQKYESRLSYTFVCPDFSNDFARFTYNEDKDAFEFTATATSTMRIYGFMGYTTHQVQYVSIKITEDGKLDTVKIEAISGSSTEVEYTIEFDNYGTTSSITLPR